ncbi:hypothetical protein NDU88_006979 [Pleurodeles waltl]|uniref:Uncharacterized protein n=1 Tax=Pleurodeles waltl TaxID=8319 RepID=A0AAV7N2H9_PLEWA|nr:hypothetical protein NDU88_006979 [Pleurodeles waltl]
MIWSRPVEKRRKTYLIELGESTKTNINNADTILDFSGQPMFDPTLLRHPNSTEWSSCEHVATYVMNKLRQPLDKLSCSKLRSECPRPALTNNITATPSIDRNILLFFTKFGKDPKKGVDRAWTNCQDRLLDLSGPLTRTLDLPEEARIEGTKVDPVILYNWARIVICLLGNDNSDIAQVRHKSLLLKIDPKLSNLAIKEAGQEANGLLFGDSFIKDLSKYVATFASTDKAQTSLQKIFNSRVFGRAGKGRSCFAGRYISRGAVN